MAVRYLLSVALPAFAAVLISCASYVPPNAAADGAALYKLFIDTVESPRKKFELLQQAAEAGHGRAGVTGAAA
jgi:hypothetical protein